MTARCLTSGDAESIKTAAATDRLDLRRTGDLRQERRDRILPGDAMAVKNDELIPITVMHRRSYALVVLEHLDRYLPQPLTA